MSLPGQPHPHGGPNRAAQSAGRHERIAAGQTPPPPALRTPSASPAAQPVEPSHPRRRLPGGSLTIAALPFLIPDDDPWDRERWRRLGERPNPGFS